MTAEYSIALEEQVKLLKQVLVEIVSARVAEYPEMIESERFKRLAELRKSIAQDAIDLLEKK